MEILNEGQLAARLDYMRPLKAETENPESVWCIPFEYGANEKGTRISIALAKTIAAELRMHVAEADKRELRRAFDNEVKRSDETCKQSAVYQNETFQLKAEIAVLQRRLRAKRKAK